jgi:hypothetical protein
VLFLWTEFSGATGSSFPFVSGNDNAKSRKETRVFLDGICLWRDTWLRIEALVVANSLSPRQHEKREGMPDKVCSDKRYRLSPRSSSGCSPLS